MVLMPAVHPRSGGTEGRPHQPGYYVRDHVLAAVNPAKSMATLAVELLYDGAIEGKRVKSDAGRTCCPAPKLRQPCALRRELRESPPERLSQLPQRILHQYAAVRECIGHPVTIPDELHL
jgi:hypothetical protein